MNRVRSSVRFCQRSDKKEHSHMKRHDNRDNRDPAIFKLLPEGRFFKVVADVHWLVADDPTSFSAPSDLLTVMISTTGHTRNQKCYIRFLSGSLKKRM